MDTVKHRSDIDPQYQWDLTDIFPSVDAWKNTFDTVKETIPDLAAYKDKDLTDPETLHAFLELEETVLRDMADLSTYAHLKAAEDTTDQDAQALKQQAQTLGAQVNKAVSFFEPRIKELGRDTITQLCNENSALQQYQHYFDDILRTADHTLSQEEESLLGALSDVMYGASNVYTLLTNADIEFPTVEKPGGDTVQLTLNNFTTLLKESPQSFRETVHTQFYNTFKQYEHAVSDAYSNTVRTNTNMADIRNYQSALHGTLDGNNIPVTVYTTLLDTVQDNLEPLHRHLQLKRETVDGGMRMWDLYLNLAQDEDATISYDNAKTLVLNAVQPLGEEYVEIAEQVFTNRWIDVYETPSKRSGAFTSGTYNTHAYIAMNWQGDVNSLYTLAHELGHAVHRELVDANQPYIYSHNPIFTAEVASTVNEALLTQHLLQEEDGTSLQALALNQFLENFRTTLYRQTMFAAFEKHTHEHVENGGALTPDWLHGTYRELKEAFCTPVTSDNLIQYEWMRIPHFYNAFYVYQYATGFSAAVALIQQIRDRGPDTYINFLKQGGSDYPVTLLQEAGVDPTTPEPVTAALDVYRDHLDTMENHLSQ